MKVKHGIKILKKLGKDKFCAWVRKQSKKHNLEINLEGANLEWAYLYRANLEGADLYGANLKRAYLYKANLYRANLYKANLEGVYLEGANIDFSCWPLWCGSSNVTIDERIAKQLGAHCFNAIRKYWPGGLTKEQIDWLNDFHRIKSDEFPKFE